MTHRMGPKGQVVIPKELRRRLGIEPGDEVDFVLGEGEVRVRRAGGVHRLRGILAESEVDLAETLLAERRRDTGREEHKARRLTGRE